MALLLKVNRIIQERLFFENIIYHGHGLDNSKEPIKTYVYGIARYGDGDDALYCSYDFNSKDFAHSIKFGGKDDYIIDLDGGYKEIFKINSSNDLSFYVIYHYYCVTKLNIVGRQKNGKWVSYIDSQDVSKRYFNGKDDYKEDGGVIYDEPICYNDSVIITYRRWHWGGTSEPEGEIRLKWDDKVQWFGIDCKKY